MLCAEGFAPARIGLEARLEGLRRVHELLGQLAKLLIIVKTLNHTRAIKGFYYAMKGCRPVMKGCTPVMKGCTPVMYLGMPAIIDTQRATNDCKPDEKLRRLAMSLDTPGEAFDTPG